MAAFAGLMGEYLRHDVSLLSERRRQTQLGSCSQPFPQRLLAFWCLPAGGATPTQLCWGLVATKGLYPRGSPFLLGVCVSRA